MNTRLIAGMMTLAFATTTVAAFAQKSRRVVRQEGLTVQSTAPVDGTATTGGGGKSPEIYGTDGGATKSAVPGQTAATGLTGTTGRVSDNTSTLLSAGRGGIVTPAVAATAVPYVAPTTTSDQSMLPMLLGALAGALGGGGQKTNGTTNTANTNTNNTNNNPNTAANTNNPAATTPASTTTTPTSTTPTATQSDQPQGAKKCSDYRDGDKDKATSPFRVEFEFDWCASDASVGGPYVMQLKPKKGTATSIDVFPIADGKVVAFDKTTAYGCRVIVKHDRCPIAGVAASGPCYSSYGNLDMGEDGKCPKGQDFTSLPKAITAGTALGQAKMMGHPRHMSFEMRTAPDKVALTKTYECAISRFAKGNDKNRRCSQTASRPSSDHAGSTQNTAPPPWVEGTR